MVKRWGLTGAALACLVIAPIAIEAYTFHLYEIREPSFFTFSGARLWVFLILQLLLGVVIGLAGSAQPMILGASAAAAIAVLIAMFYHFCNPTQCYYAGPDGLGEFRVGTLFFATTTIGIMIGSLSPPVVGRNGLVAVFFGSVVALFAGFFPWVLVFATYLPTHLGVPILITASVAPFLFSGAVSRIFSERRRHAIISAITGSLVLMVLFSLLRPSSLPLAFMMLACSAPAALAGFLIASRAAKMRGKVHKTSGLLAGLLTFFIMGASHPLIDAPMNLALDPTSTLLPQPTYYAGAYHYSETYLSSKRVEVEIDFGHFDPLAITNFLFAGIGAQSPNCCKDGLDYGYRADVYFNKSGLFLAARAWETCDINIACSGHPWDYPMHQSLVPFGNASATMMLAMEWQQDGRTVEWSYRIAGGKWKEYSRFVSPVIENPYFNLGVIPVGNPFTNPGIGNAFFYQVGISRPSEAPSSSGSIGFHCPAYYDKDGTKRCVQLEPVGQGNSHWKALWKWGIQDTNAVVETDGSYAKITLT